MKTIFRTFGILAIIFFANIAYSVKNTPVISHRIDTVKAVTISNIDFEFVSAVYENDLLKVTLNATSNNKDRVIAIFKDDYNKKEAVIKYYVNYKQKSKSLRVVIIDKNGNEYKPETITIGNNKVERNASDYGSIYNLCRNTLYEGTKSKIEFTFKVENKIDFISLIAFDFYLGSERVKGKELESFFNVKLRNVTIKQ